MLLTNFISWCWVPISLTRNLKWLSFQNIDGVWRKRYNSRGSCMCVFVCVWIKHILIFLKLTVHSHCVGELRLAPVVCCCSSTAIHTSISAPQGCDCQRRSKINWIMKSLINSTIHFTFSPIVTTDYLSIVFPCIWTNCWRIRATKSYITALECKEGHTHFTILYINNISEMPYVPQYERIIKLSRYYWRRGTTSKTNNHRCRESNRS